MYLNYILTIEHILLPKRAVRIYNLTIETDYALNCDERCIDYIFILPGTGNCKIDFFFKSILLQKQNYLEHFYFQFNRSTYLIIMYTERYIVIINMLLHMQLKS
jgi:hypothetical protein